MSTDEGLSLWVGFVLGVTFTAVLGTSAYLWLDGLRWPAAGVGVFAPALLALVIVNSRRETG